MKRFIISLALACVTVFTFAQTSKVLRQRIEVAEVTSEENNTEIKAFYKLPKRSKAEIQGNFAAVYPTAELIPVTVTSRRFLFSKVLEFSIPTPGSETVVRATHIYKTNFSSLLASLKIYRKLHPKQQ